MLYLIFPYQQPNTSASHNCSNTSIPENAAPWFVLGHTDKDNTITDTGITIPDENNTTFVHVPSSNENSITPSAGSSLDEEVPVAVT